MRLNSFYYYMILYYSSYVLLTMAAAVVFFLIIISSLSSRLFLYVAASRWKWHDTRLCVITIIIMIIKESGGGGSDDVRSTTAPAAFPCSFCNKIGKQPSFSCVSHILISMWKWGCHAMFYRQIQYKNNVHTQSSFRVFFSQKHVTHK